MSHKGKERAWDDSISAPSSQKMRSTTEESRLLEEELIRLGWPGGPLSLANGIGGRGAGERRSQKRPILIVSPHVLIHCPPLHSARQFPTLLSTDLIPSIPPFSISQSSAKEGGKDGNQQDGEPPRKKPRLSKSNAAFNNDPSKSNKSSSSNKNLPRKSYHLPLPPSLTRIPYTYGPASFLSRSHDPNYFIAFFPKLAENAGLKMSRKVIPAMSDGSTGKEEESQSEEEDQEDESGRHSRGGLLVLYCRPQLSPSGPSSIISNDTQPMSLNISSSIPTVYTHTFHVHSSYEISDGGVIGATWLFEPRRWVIKPTGREESNGQSKDEGNGNRNGDGNGNDDGKVEDTGELDVDMDKVFESVNDQNNGEREHDGINGNGELHKVNGGSRRGATDSNGKIPKLERLPAYGPINPNSSKLTGGIGSSGPAFVILLSNHRINFYFSSRINAADSGLVTSLQAPRLPQFGSSYIPLNVLSCDITQPSISVQGQNHPNIFSNRNHYIRESQSHLSLRSNDERIWVSYRTTRRKRISPEWILGSSSLMNPNDGSDLGRAVTGVGGGELRRQSVYSDAPSPDVPLALSSRIPHVDQFPNMGPSLPGSGTGPGHSISNGGERLIPGANMTTTQAQGILQNMQTMGYQTSDTNQILADLKNSALGRAGMGVAGTLFGAGGGAAAAEIVKEADEEWKEMLVQDDFGGPGSEEGEEDWVQVVELRVSFLEGAVSLQARPIPRIPIEVRGNSNLQSLSFIELPPVPDPEPDVIDGGTVVVQAVDGKRPAAEDRRDPDRPIGLLLTFRQYDKGSQSGSTKVETWKIERKEIILSDAFSALGSGISGTAISSGTRWDWLPTLSETRVVPKEWLTVAADRLDSGGQSLLVRRTVMEGLGRSSLALLDAHSLVLTEITPSNTDDTTSSFAFSINDNTIAVRRGDQNIRLLSLDKATTQSLAEQLSVCLYQRRNPSDILHVIARHGTTLDSDAMMRRAWYILDGQDYDSESNPEKIGVLLPFVQMHTECLRIIRNPLYRLSVSFLRLVAADQAFNSCIRMIPRRSSNSSLVNGSSTHIQKPEFIRAFDLESIWLMLAHTEWTLDIMKTILREALLCSLDSRLSEDLDRDWIYTDYPHLSQLYHSASRALLKRLCAHAFGFILFLFALRTAIAPHPLSSSILQRDPSATNVAQLMLREKVESSGLRLDGVGKAISDIGELFKDGQSNGMEGVVDRHEAESTPLPYEVRISMEHLSLLPRIVNRLANDPGLLRSQAVLINSATDPAGILCDSERDVITKERLPKKMIYGADGSPLTQWRQCNRCGGRSIVYQTTTAIGDGNGDGMGNLINGLMGETPAGRKNGYAARSCWEKEMRKYVAACSCGGGWVPV